MASRSYGLERGESVPDGAARIARGRIDHAIDELTGNSDSSPEEAVHGARKDMKKLRALLRLVRGEIGDKRYRREAACFRDAGRELAGVRDADVMLATLDSLGLSKRAGGPLRQALEAHKIRTGAGTREQAAAAATEILTEARARVADWPLERDGFAPFEEGLERIYRRGRRGYRAARRDPTAENLHEWRKRVKDLWYHCSILEASWPPVMKALADEAHELSDRLGDDHDLAVLLAWAQENTGAADTAPLEAAVAERRAQLQAEAFAYGARLYADKPGAFVARIERWWDASAPAEAASPRRAA
jgi:CHAD domain-containing protein